MQEKKWFLSAWIFVFLTIVFCPKTWAEAASAPYERKVEHEVTYEDIEGAADIPEEIEVEVRDGDQETIAVCRIQDVSEVDSRWVDGFELPLTFHVYDAEEYALDDRIVPRDDTMPQVLDCENELLAMAGLSPADYRLTEAAWNGDVYVDENGESCRDAVAWGQKRIGTYRVLYAGTAVFAELPGYLRRTDAETEVETEEVQPEETQAEEASPEMQEPEIRAAEVYIMDEPEAIPEKSPWEILWERIIRTLIWAIGLGVVLLIFGLLMIVVLRMVKWCRVWYDRRKRKSSRRR